MVTAENKKKYISFNVNIDVNQVGSTNRVKTYVKNIDKEVWKNNLTRFIYSYRLMTSTLDKLASNFHDAQAKNHSQLYNGEKIFKLMRYKGPNLF